MAGQGLARLPRSVALLFLLSKCEFKLQNLPGAERALLEAMGLVPEHPVLLCRYAALLARAGRRDEAARWLDRAEAAAPDHPLVRQERTAMTAALAGGSWSVIEDQADPYARAAIGMSLLSLTPAAKPPADAGGRGRWLHAVRLGLVGLAVTFAAAGLRLPAVIAFVAALIAPRLWRVRG